MTALLFSSINVRNVSFVFCQVAKIHSVFKCILLSVDRVLFQTVSKALSSTLEQGPVRAFN